jgi:hypothetical protein
MALQRWSLHQKINRRMNVIHGPVPFYQTVCTPPHGRGKANAFTPHDGKITFLATRKTGRRMANNVYLVHQAVYQLSDQISLDPQSAPTSERLTKD